MTLPPPQNLQWEWADSLEKEHIQLCWSAPTGANDKIEGYAFYSDYAREGNVRRLNSLPIIRDHQFIYTLKNKQRNTLTIRIATVGKDGVHGRYSEVVIPIDNNQENTNIE